MVYFILSVLLLGGMFVVFYSFSATLLKWIPSNRYAKPMDSGVEIWVVSNGPHTDIVLPIRSAEIDWTEFVDTKAFKPSQFNYISFGWGDRGFYLDTPSWAKLKPKTAFKALFKLGKTTMQVVLYDDIPSNLKWVKSLTISTEQYQNIIAYIKQSFKYSDDGELMHIDFAGLPAYDALNYNFYEAEGQYHFLKTCNCWVNNALKEGEVKTPTWAPFSKAIFHQLDKAYPEEEIYGEPMMVYNTTRKQKLKKLLNRIIR